MPLDARLEAIRDSDEYRARLLFRLAEGSDEAFEEIYELYWDKLLRFVQSKIKSRENAEEIIQDIFIDLWERRESRRIHHLNSYLFRAARNKVLDALRAQIVREQHRDHAVRQNDDSDSGTEATLAYRDLSDAVQMALTRMPDKTREVFHMNRFEFLTIREISNRLNLSERTVEYHIAHALQTLRLYLKDFLPSLLLLACF